MLNSNIKVDLHIHSKASKYKESPGLVEDSDAGHLQALMDKLTENGINLFSITDHNRFDLELYEAIGGWLDDHSNSAVMNVLAGVEFDVEFEKVKPACHVITIFDVGERHHDQSAWLSKCKAIRDAIEADKLSGKGDVYPLDRFERLLKRINLAVVLIAHQHQGMLNEGIKKRSLGSATDEATEYVRYGYIDALEYTKANVQGILLNELQELDIDAATLCGSDCHDWSSYPAHDRSGRPKDRPYFTIRALPTFRGLTMALSSVDTRFNRPELEFRRGMLEVINVNGGSIQLSPGINAIIGENGVGKSSLIQAVLPGKRPKHVTSFIKNNEVSSQGSLESGGYIYVSQGDLQNKFSSTDAEGLFDRSLFLPVDHTMFERRVKNFSSKLKNAVLDNIGREANRKSLSSCNVMLKPELEGNTSFYFEVYEDQGFTAMDNDHEDHAQQIRNALDILRDELGSGYYDGMPAQRERLERAITELSSVLSVLARLSHDTKMGQKVRNVISNAITRYNASIDSLKTDDDSELSRYRAEKNAVVEAVLNVAGDESSSLEKPSLVIDDGMGVSEKPINGFKFVSTASYAKSVDVQDDLLGEIFNKDYASIEKVLAIRSDEDASRAVSFRRANGVSWQDAWDSNVTAFINKQKDESRSILRNESEAVGGTLGEMSLTYYEYQAGLKETSVVFLADQPEDNISNSRIANGLVSYLNRMRPDRQVIIVTHNPLLVVNQDVDNVLVLSQDSGGKLQVQSGCLESDGVLPAIAKNMEGGTRAIRRRLKAYGTYDDD